MGVVVALRFSSLIFLVFVESEVQHAVDSPCRIMVCLIIIVDGLGGGWESLKFSRSKKI